LRFGPQEHQGSHHVWMTEIREGVLASIDDW
jgi:hypothetical protein